MSNIAVYRVRDIVFAICIAFFHSLLAAAPLAEEKALQTKVEMFFVAYSKKDLPNVVALWSEKSPDLTVQKQSWQQHFAAEDAGFGSPVISRLDVEGEKASLRVMIEQTVVHRKTKEKREHRLARKFEFVKEAGEWKIWRYYPAANDLAETLAKTRGDAAINALLMKETELVTPELVEALIRQGGRPVKQGDYQTALALYRLAHRVAEQIGDQTGLADALRCIGIVHGEQSDFRQAIEYYDKSVAISEAAGDKGQLARTLNNIGNAHREQSNFEQAKEYYQKSAVMHEGLGNNTGTAAAMHNLGNVYYEQGDYEHALESYGKSLSLLDSDGDSTIRASALYNIGNVLAARGDYAAAMEHFQKSLAMQERLGNKADMARTLDSIGNVNRMQGSYEQALVYMQRGLAISEAVGDRTQVAWQLMSIGSVHYKQGKYDSALEYLQKSFAMQETLGHKAGSAITLNSIGHVYARKGNDSQALEYFEKSLARQESLGDKAIIANSLTSIAMIHEKQQRYAEALDFAGRAADLAHRIGFSETLWEAHLVAGKAYRALNQPDKARQALEEAIATIETLRAQVAGGEQEKERFFESKLSPYFAMIELLMDQNDVAGALTYSERGMARVLLDVIHDGRVDITKAMTSREQEQDRELKNMLASLNSRIYAESLRRQPDQARLGEIKAQLRKARLDLEAFRTSLYAAHPELKAQRGEAPPFRLEEANALLPDGRTALLEFVVADETSYLFVITKEAVTAAVKVYPLEIKLKDLAGRIERLRSMLAAVDNRFPNAARELYRLLLEPAADQLRGKSRLVIVPDGPLWELPIQALQTPQGRYLIEDHAIFYAPSLTVLREMIKARSQRIRSSAPALLALGNPTLGTETVTRAKAVLMDEKLDPLPDAERQVTTLRKIYGPNDSRVYVGAEAREERFKSEAKDFRLLHVATHGVFNDHSPMYSYLLLAQSGEMGKEDGLLEARELMQLDLKADLAVLAACETARGRVGNGEGMIGMTWALFVAGVPTTVVSQWKVRSDSTAELMIEFHRQLKARRAGGPGGNSVAAAIREAALNLKRDQRYQHPFHWAGFVVVGDGY